MATYGAFSPSPERCGGGKRRLQYVLDALVHAAEQEVGLDASGPPLQTTGTRTWCEEMATARMLDCAWSTNARASNEFDPRRTQSMLARWEAIFGVVPFSTDTPVERRARLTFKWQKFNQNPTLQQIADDLAFLAPGTFLSITPTSSTTGPSYYPGSTFSNPYDLTGSTTAGASLVDWWSNVLHVAVRVAQPAGLAGSAYQSYVAAINQYLDGTLPAWITWSCYQLAHVGAIGFFLDEANFDLEALRV